MTNSSEELIKRMATSNEPNPIRRFHKVYKKDPDLVAEAVLELISLHLRPTQARLYDQDKDDV